MEPLPSPVPRLETERLVLRQLRATDFATWAAVMADPEATAFIARITEPRAAFRSFASLTGQWLLTGSGWWGIELVETGALVGTVGAFFRESQLDRGADADLELGWTVFPAYQRKGIASEAARAAFAYGAEVLRPARAIAHIAADNHASIGVARRIGMELDAEVSFYGEPALRFVKETRPRAP